VLCPACAAAAAATASYIAVQECLVPLLAEAQEVLAANCCYAVALHTPATV
jgi:hypothetical protein